MAKAPNRPGGRKSLRIAGLSRERISDISCGLPARPHLARKIPYAAGEGSSSRRATRRSPRADSRWRRNLDRRNRGQPLLREASTQRQAGKCQTRWPCAARAQFGWINHSLGRRH